MNSLMKISPASYKLQNSKRSKLIHEKNDKFGTKLLHFFKQKTTGKFDNAKKPFPFLELISLTRHLFDQMKKT